MPKNCRNVDEMMNKYLDGELSRTSRARFEEMLRNDPSLKNRLDRYRNMLRCLKAFRKVRFPASGLRQARAAIMRRISRFRYNISRSANACRCAVIIKLCTCIYFIQNSSAGVTDSCEVLT